MKKLLAILLFSTVFGVAAQAQKDSTATKKPSFKEVVGVSKETDQKIKDIKAEYKAKEEAILSDASLDDKAKKVKKKENKAEREEKINALLTPEQRVKYVEYQEQMKAWKEAHPE